MEELTLLAEATEDIQNNHWTEPAVCELMKQMFHVQCAHEAVTQCNIEIQCLHTAIMDEHQLFDVVLKKLEDKTSPILGAMIEFFQCCRHINTHILACLQYTYSMNRFSGHATPGIQEGTPLPVQSTTIDDILQEAHSHLDEDTAEQDEEDLREEATEAVGRIVSYLTELAPLSI